MCNMWDHSISTQGHRPLWWTVWGLTGGRMVAYHCKPCLSIGSQVVNDHSGELGWGGRRIRHRSWRVECHDPALPRGKRLQRDVRERAKGGINGVIHTTPWWEREVCNHTPLSWGVALRDHLQPIYVHMWACFYVIGTNKTPPSDSMYSLITSSCSATNGVFFVADTRGTLPSKPILKLARKPSTMRLANLRSGGRQGQPPTH